MAIKRILVALSGTPFTRSAIRYAIDLARHHDAELTGVTLFHEDAIEQVGPVPLGGAEAAREWREQRADATRESIHVAIADFESACAETGMTACLDRESGDPLDRLLALWRYHDLFVFGLRGLFDYGVVHHPDDLVLRLIQSNAQPVVCVSEEHRPIRRVVIAYNGSMASASALKEFVTLRPWPNIAARIVCFGRDDHAQVLLKDGAAYCHAHGLEVETEHVPGSTRHDILGYVRKDGADLLVMGSSSRARILKHILGDAALDAIKHAEIPLFLAN